MRRHRERRREGLRCATIELRETEIDILVQKGLLNADARNDARSVREALYGYFDNTLNYVGGGGGGGGARCVGEKCRLIFKAMTKSTPRRAIDAGGRDTQG